MTTYAQALAEINAKIISGAAGHLTPAKLQSVLAIMLDAAEDETGAAAAAVALASSNSWQWNLDTSTTMADPGTGEVRFNHATWASVTAIAISDLTADTGNPDRSAAVLAWDDSTNAHKGTLTFRKRTATSQYVEFAITGASTDNSGWTQLAVTHVQGAPTWVAGEELAVAFSRSGNAGATGSGSGDLIAANNLSDVANAATARANLGLTIGTHVQAYAANLTSWAGIAPAAKQDALGYTPVNKAGDSGIGMLSMDRIVFTRGVNITGTDLNALTNAGFYDGDVLTNAPGGSAAWFHVEVLRHTGDALWAVQKAYALSTSDQVWIRWRLNGTWGSWQKLWFAGNAGATSGLDADLVDGQHGSFYRDASNLNAGTAPTARLGSGTANSSTFLRGDSTWAAAGSANINDQTSASSTSFPVGTILLVKHTSPTTPPDKNSATTTIYVGAGNNVYRNDNPGGYTAASGTWRNCGSIDDTDKFGLYQRVA